MMKGKFKRGICFVLCFVLVSASLLGSHINARAEEDIIDQLVYYALTMAGYVKLDMSSGGGGHPFGKGFSPSDPAGSSGKNIYQSVYDAFQYAYQNHHIQQDDAGNITFDNEVTQNFYNVFNSSGIGGYQAKLISGNPDFSDYTDNSFADSVFINAVNDMRSAYPKYLEMSGNFDDYAFYAVYDLSDVAFLAFGQGGDGYRVRFYDSSGNLLNVRYKYASLKLYNGSYSNCYYYSGGDGVKTSETLDNYFYVSDYSGNLTTFYLEMSSRYDPNFGINSSLEMLQAIYNHFPNIPYYLTDHPGRDVSKIAFSSSVPMVLGIDQGNGYHGWLASDDTPEYVNVNNYNVIPSVTGDQITNNDFRQVYNNYINNVNEVYNNSNDDFDLDKFLQVLRDQNTIVTTAVQNGVGDIIGVIQSTGQKIDIVIGLLEEIKALLASGGSGGGSSGSGGGLTSEQINQLLIDLAYVKNNMVSSSEFQSVMSSVSTVLASVEVNTSDTYDELVSVNNELVAIYNQLVSLGSGGGSGGGSSSDDDNYYYGDNYYITTYNTDLPSIVSFGEDGESDFDDNVIDVMKGVVPFVFIFAVGALFTELACPPEVPKFQIPFKIDSLGYEQNIDVDFTNFGALHDVLDYGICILFILGLMWYYIRLMQLVITTFF